MRSVLDAMSRANLSSLTATFAQQEVFLFEVTVSDCKSFRKEGIMVKKGRSKAAAGFFFQFLHISAAFLFCGGDPLMVEHQKWGLFIKHLGITNTVAAIAQAPFTSQA